MYNIFFFFASMIKPIHRIQKNRRIANRVAPHVSCYCLFGYNIMNENIKIIETQRIVIHSLSRVVEDWKNY